MNYQQQDITNRLWDNYQLFKNNPQFNNNKYPGSEKFYEFQDYMNTQNPMLVYPILDYYISYGAENDYFLLVYLLYSPFIWENKAYRYQLSKLLHNIKTNELISGYILKEEFDDYFLGLILSKSISISIAYGMANSLNLWFYLGSYNLITDNLSIDLDVDMQENVIPDLVGSFYSSAKIAPEKSTDWFTVSDAISRLSYNIYGISLNKPFKNDYIHDFLKELNEFVQYMYKEANGTIQKYFSEVYKVYKIGGLINEESYQFYKSLFIKYGYNVDELILPGIILLTRMLEDVIDYYLANIPFIYRTKLGYIQLNIEEYLKIFHCLFGVGTHELYTISNS